MSDPTSPRLVFRRLVAADLPALGAHYGLPEVRHFLWDDEAPDEAQLAAVLAGSDEDFARHGYGLWTLRLVGSPSRIIGSVGLRRRTEGVEVLYSLDPDCWSRGLASEAVGAVLSQAFEVLGLPRIYAGVDEGNQRSSALLRRLTFQPVGPALWVKEA